MTDVSDDTGKIMERMSILPRWVHRACAFVGGYFWLPCPLCGDEFGGHEWRDRDGRPSGINVPGEPGSQRGICPRCTRAGLGDRR